MKGDKNKHFNQEKTDTLFILFPFVLDTMWSLFLVLLTIAIPPILPLRIFDYKHHPTSQIVYDSFSQASSMPCLHGVVDSLLLAYYTHNVAGLEPSDFMWMFMQGLEDLRVIDPSYHLLAVLNHTTAQRISIEAALATKSWSDLQSFSMDTWKVYLDVVPSQFNRLFYSQHQTPACVATDQTPTYLSYAKTIYSHQEPPGYMQIGLTAHHMERPKLAHQEWTDLHKQISLILDFFTSSGVSAHPWLIRMQELFKTLASIYPHQGTLSTTNPTLSSWVFQILEPAEDKKMVKGWLLELFPRFWGRIPLAARLDEFPSGISERHFTWNSQPMSALYGFAQPKMVGDSNEWKLVSSLRAMWIGTQPQPPVVSSGTFATGPKDEL